MQVSESATQEHFLSRIIAISDETISGTHTVKDFKELFDQIESIKRHFSLSQGIESQVYQLANALTVLSNLLPPHYEEANFTVPKVCQSNPVLNHWLNKAAGHRAKIKKT